jgi:hypothetical protein
MPAADLLSPRRGGRYLWEVAQAELLERGELYFLYTPRVRPGGALPITLDDGLIRLRDVQRLYVVLRPERRFTYRRLLVGRKRMPDPQRRQRFWAEIERVERSAAAVLQDLHRFEYDTKTRGRRVQPAAKAAGEGVYALLRHGSHAHLTYRLVDPASPGQVQRALGILPRASYIAAAFNPEAPPRLGRRPPDVSAPPSGLREKFGDKRFAPLDPHLLDVEGLELVLIGTSGTADEATGIEPWR